MLVTVDEAKLYLRLDEIEKELKRTMSRISDVIGFDISDIINKNSKEVFCY